MRHALPVVAALVFATAAWGADRACPRADTAAAQKSMDRVLN